MVVPDSVSEGMRCCVCWTGPPVGRGKLHSHHDCPWLLAFNKVRSQDGLAPILFGNGGFQAVPAREPLKLEKVAKDLGTLTRETRGQVAALDKRTTVLEKHVGLKRKAESSGTADVEQPKKKKKKSKKSKKADGAGEGSSSGGKPKDVGQQQQQQSTSGGGKGKGKAKE
jgi:hypothetical protein